MIKYIQHLFWYQYFIDKIDEFQKVLDRGSKRSYEPIRQVQSEEMKTRKANHLVISIIIAITVIFVWVGNIKPLIAGQNIKHESIHKPHRLSKIEWLVKLKRADYILTD